MFYQKALCIQIKIASSLKHGEIYDIKILDIVNDIKILRFNEISLLI